MCRLWFRGIYLQKKALQKTKQWHHTLTLIDVGNASFEERYDEIQRKGNQNFLGTVQIAFNSSDTNNIPDGHIAVIFEREQVKMQETISLA